MCPNRTGRQDRAGQRGKSDTLDSERIARAHPLLPRAFKRSGEDAGPDEQTELLSVWWNARCSLLKSHQHLLSEAEALLGDLTLELIERLPDSKACTPGSRRSAA